jgi:hypothetical protein
VDPNTTYVAKINSADPNFEEKVEYRSVLAGCFDFVNEMTCFMYLGEKLGVEVDCFHPELTGERIEYSWGHVKKMCIESQTVHKER